MYGAIARYIDADKLDTRPRGNNSQRTMWLQIKWLIDGAPTADVMEVRHGEWIKAPCSEKDGDAHCSECNHWDWSDCKYCSRCGAKMDKYNKPDFTNHDGSHDYD